MKRYRVVIITLLLILGGVLAYSLALQGRASWSGPVIGLDSYGTESCGNVVYVVPRFLSKYSGSVVVRSESVVLWEDVIVTKLPEDYVVEHGKSGPVRVGDRVCTVDGSQLWIHKPTGWPINYWCSLVDWPDCPPIEELVEFPHEYEWWT